MKRTIQTFTGRHLDVFDPNPDDIVIEDIIHGLDNVCRFGGHTKRFYSVLEHSFRVYQTVFPMRSDLGLQALLHDASEAYIGDMPAPIKQHLPDYRALEEGLMKAIAAKFNFAWPMDEMVNEVDWMVFEYERDQALLTNRILPLDDLQGLFKLAFTHATQWNQESKALQEQHPLQLSNKKS